MQAVLVFESSMTSALSPPHLRLRHATAAHHERMHAIMGRLDVFASRDTYARFVQAQYRFQRDLSPLLEWPSLAAHLPDLPRRSRIQACLQDLADLGAAPSAPEPAVGVSEPAQAWGWLYVSEGSTLGAALLLQQAHALGLSEDFGARHLAAHPRGRAGAWREFQAALDAAVDLPQQTEQAIVGACAAFDRFGALLEEASPPAGSQR